MKYLSSKWKHQGFSVQKINYFLEKLDSLEESTSLKIVFEKIYEIYFFKIEKQMQKNWRMRKQA